jgi:hypothetical protein
MSEEQKVSLYTLRQAHLYFATGCLHECRKMLVKEHRTKDEDELLKHNAHASMYHWLQIGETINFVRGEWMLARVYTVLEVKAKALHYALRCLDITQQLDLKDYDLAIAYECVARAYALVGDKIFSDKYFKLAVEAGELISEADDKKQFFDDLESGKWFGIK